MEKAYKIALALKKEHTKYVQKMLYCAKVSKNDKNCSRKENLEKKRVKTNKN